MLAPQAVVERTDFRQQAKPVVCHKNLHEVAPGPVEAIAGDAQYQAFELPAVHIGVANTRLDLRVLHERFQYAQHSGPAGEIVPVACQFKYGFRVRPRYGHRFSHVVRYS
ncbi:hypothetical protein D3C83_07930 [compost metagenome]